MAACDPQETFGPELPTYSRLTREDVRPVIGSGLLKELIDQFCDLLRRVLVAVVANAF